MRVFKGLSAVHRPPPRAVVTVGVFDGVHLAHQRLIRSAVTLARRIHGTSVAITFDPDPHAVLHPAQAHPALMPLEARVAALERAGIDWLWILPFTKRFARTTPRQFVLRFLKGRLQASALIVGEAFVFGNHRQGDLAVLKAMGPSIGMRVIPVRQVRRGGAPISSSRIRRLIAAGRLTDARRLLGRAPSLYGVVVRGAGRGRRLGCPTANIRLIPQVLPPQGVYAVTVDARHGGRARRGVTPPPMSVRDTRTASRRFAFGEYRGGGVMNLGVRPTFGPGALVCEVHLLGFSGTLLGASVAVSLMARLRGERCFPSAQALRKQVRRDIARARRMLRFHSHRS